jgi:choline dehydrogenase-like flavoprotein
MGVTGALVFTRLAQDGLEVLVLVEGPEEVRRRVARQAPGRGQASYAEDLMEDTASEDIQTD